ncbi:Hypothetical predicted protein, partial [Marmota monax]
RGPQSKPRDARSKKGPPEAQARRQAREWASKGQGLGRGLRTLDNILERWQRIRQGAGRFLAQGDCQVSGFWVQDQRPREIKRPRQGAVLSPLGALAQMRIQVQGPGKEA